MLKRNKITIIRHSVQLIYFLLVLFGLMSKNAVFIFMTVTAVLIGPLFCGWMCAVGFYQDVINLIGRLFIKKSFELPESISKYAKYSRFIFLLGTLTLGGIFLFPGHLRHNVSLMLKGKVVFDYTLYFIAALTIISIFSKRFFCRYFCTFGAKLGVYSIIRPITINRNSDDCINCQKCYNECLMHVPMDKANSSMSLNCINCLKCIEQCPKKCLKFGIRSYLKP